MGIIGATDVFCLIHSFSFFFNKFEPMHNFCISNTYHKGKKTYFQLLLRKTKGSGKSWLGARGWGMASPDGSCCHPNTFGSVSCLSTLFPSLPGLAGVSTCASPSDIQSFITAPSSQVCAGHLAFGLRSCSNNLPLGADRLPALPQIFLFWLPRPTQIFLER